ncbi:unnamed protein product [Parascedosporium putredinis]|uniref:Shikimate dehydrogenase substrate binding N-terminal domain-containing protein n=1 Tax=Parascedosporium putredinis TaxID=1442378 RepID=A0A9P1H9D0_9PEZI|nr:unnamed protein product [Parascedosporium putredinis]CAI8000233.1 unnamed protein product [Parascedosporium putredinis]
MHNFIAKSLNLPWTFYATECATIEDLIALARNDATVGLVVTMPYKNAVLSMLDAVDDLAVTIGACNNIYRDPSDPTRLRGTNTDWLGIRGCLLETKEYPESVLNQPALIVGAGGASRAAVYALSTTFKSSVIYILNRDDGEVHDLIRDAQRIQPPPKIVHVKEGDDVSQLDPPLYVVGTVPDFEANTPAEIAVQALLEGFLSVSRKGVLLDMCFKPRLTRMIKLANKLGWHTVEGTHVIGHQVRMQYKLWAGEERSKKMDQEGAWNLLLQMAESSPGINY